MKTLGPATKAALARIVSTLPYLREQESAVPSGYRGFWQGIKQKYASKHQSEGASDPLHDAALAHAEEELATALEQDEKVQVVPVETIPETPATDVAPVESSTPPLGDFSSPIVSPEPLPVEEGK